MKLLLDTHILLWAAASSDRLPRDARDLIENKSNDIYYSAVSLWEVAIKSSLRRRDFRIDVPLLEASLPSMGFVELPITGAHAAGVSRLPPHHRDPFDRLLVSQSAAERLTIITRDAVLTGYDADVRLV